MERVVVACLGDSITAGSALRDPDPDVRARIGAANGRAQPVAVVYGERDEWTDDGDHPSVEGHRLLGERAFRLPESS